MRNEFGWKPALVTMTVLISPPWPRLFKEETVRGALVVGWPMTSLTFRIVQKLFQSRREFRREPR
jgi:hypothetical protein